MLIENDINIFIFQLFLRFNYVLGAKYTQNAHFPKYYFYFYFKENFNCLVNLKFLLFLL